MNNTTYLTIDLKELQKYATFKKQSEMDDTIYRQISRLRADEVPTSVIDVLLCLGRSSLRVLGISFNRYETIAQSIGKSKSTVIRAVRTLKQYGIIDVIPTTKKWSSYGNSRKKSVNIVRVLPSVLPQHDTAGTVNEAVPGEGYESNDSPEPILPKHQKELLHNTSSEPLSESPYTRFKSLIADKKVRNKIYGIWLAHTRYIRNSYDQDTLLAIGIKAVMVTFKTGNGKQIRSLTGYYSGTLDKMLDKLHYETMV